MRLKFRTIAFLEFRHNSVRIPSKFRQNSDKRHDPSAEQIRVPTESYPPPQEFRQNSAQQLQRSLEIIRDKRLYRSTHRTFEEYCGEVWGVSRSLAHRQIEAGKIVANLATNKAQVLPTTESQARPLAPLPPDQQVEVWEKAAEIAPDSKPTARDVEIAQCAKYHPFLV